MIQVFGNSEGKLRSRALPVSYRVERCPPYTPLESVHVLKTPSPEAAVRLCPTISVPAPCQESGWQSAATSALPHNGKAPSSANLYLCLCGSKIILSLEPGEADFKCCLQISLTPSWEMRQSQGYKTRTQAHRRRSVRIQDPSATFTWSTSTILISLNYI